jgi:hypothetical protein
VGSIQKKSNFAGAAGCYPRLSPLIPVKKGFFKNLAGNYWLSSFDHQVRVFHRTWGSHGLSS